MAVSSDQLSASDSDDNPSSNMSTKPNPHHHSLPNTHTHHRPRRRATLLLPILLNQLYLLLTLSLYFRTLLPHLRESNRIRRRAGMDAAAAATVMDLLLDAAARSGATLLVATHDPALLERLPRQIRLQAGRIVA